MNVLGYIRVLKRTGHNGSYFPCYNNCLIGRNATCQVRIYLNQVEGEHCIITGDEHGQCFLRNLSYDSPTLLNGVALGMGEVELGHGDKFTVADRTLRWEYLEDSPFYVKRADYSPISPLGRPSMSNRMVTMPLSVLQNSPSANFPTGIGVGRRSTSRATKSRKSAFSTPHRASAKVTTPLQGSSPRLITIVSSQKWSQKQETVQSTEKQDKNRRKSDLVLPVAKHLPKSMQQNSRKSVGALRRSKNVAITDFSGQFDQMFLLKNGSCMTPETLKQSAAKDPTKIMKHDTSPLYVGKKTKTPTTIIEHKKTSPLSVGRKTKTPTKIIDRKNTSPLSVGRKTKTAPATRGSHQMSSSPNDEDTFRSSRNSLNFSSDSISPKSSTSPWNIIPRKSLLSSTKVTKAVQDRKSLQIKRSSTQLTKTPGNSTRTSLKGTNSRKSVKLVSSKIAKTPVKSSTSRKSANLTFSKMAKSPKTTPRKSMTLSTKSTTPSRKSVSPINSKLLSPQSRTSELKGKSKRVPQSRLKTPTKVLKRKLVTDVQSAERAAKRLKFSKSPKIPDKKKMAALMLCHGKSPRKQILPGKLLYSDVLKRRLNTKPLSPCVVIKRATFVKGRQFLPAMKKPKKKQPPPLATVVPSTFKFNSTGHANSPETIVLGNQVSKIPLSSRKGRKKTELMKQSKKLAKDNSEVFSVQQLLQVDTPLSKHKTGMAVTPILSTTSTINSGSGCVKELQVSPSVHESTRKSVRFSPAIVFGRQHQESQNVEEDGRVRRSIMKGKESNSFTESLEYASVNIKNVENIKISNISPRSDITVNMHNFTEKQIEEECFVPSSGSSNTRKSTSKTSNTSTPLGTVTIDKPESVQSGRKRTRSSNEANETSTLSMKKKLKFTDGTKISLNKSEMNLTSPQRSMKSLNAVSPVGYLSKKRFSDSRASVKSVPRLSIDHISNEHISPTRIGRKSSKLNVSADRNSSLRHEGNKSPIASLSPASSKSLKTSSRLNTSLELGDRSDISIIVKSKDPDYNNALLASSSAENTPLASGKKRGRSSSRFTNESVCSFDGNGTTFDFNSVNTPRVPREHFVSPLSNSSNRTIMIKSLSPGVISLSPRVILEKTSPSTIKLLYSPKNDEMDAHELKGIRTPEIKHSPKNDLTDVRDVKRLDKTPRIQQSPRNDLTDVNGVKTLMKTPKIQRSPKNDLTDVFGVKKLVMTPQVRRSPKNDLTDIRGVKNLMNTPRIQRSPRNDLTDVRGVKRLMKTPRIQRSPKNDLTDVRGVKRLMKTTRIRPSPKNDLTDVDGIQELMNTGGISQSPKNNLRNLSKSPQSRNSPKSVDKKDIVCFTAMQSEELENINESNPTHDKKSRTPPRRGRGPGIALVENVKLGSVSPGLNTEAKSNLGTELKSEEVLTKPRRARKAASQEIIGVPEIADTQQRSVRGRQTRKDTVLTTGNVSDVETTPAKGRRVRPAARKADLVSDVSEIQDAQITVRKGRSDNKEVARLSNGSDVPVTPIKSRRGTRATVKEVARSSVESDVPETPNKIRRGRAAAKTTNEADTGDTKIKLRQSKAVNSIEVEIVDLTNTPGTPRKQLRSRAAPKEKVQSPDELNTLGTSVKGKQVKPTKKEIPISDGAQLAGTIRLRRGKIVSGSESLSEKTIDSQESPIKRARRRKVDISVEVPEMRESKPKRGRLTKQDTVFEAPSVESNSIQETASDLPAKRRRGVKFSEESPLPATAETNSPKRSKRRLKSNDVEETESLPKRRKALQDEDKKKRTAKVKDFSPVIEPSTRNRKVASKMSKKSSPVTTRKTRSQR